VAVTRRARHPGDTIVGDTSCGRRGPLTRTAHLRFLNMAAHSAKAHASHNGSCGATSSQSACVNGLEELF
jgi:hypothetical protein